MDRYRDIIEVIAKQTGKAFGPASADGLKRLRKLGIPESVLRFYELYEPKVAVHGQVVLSSIEDMVIENTKGVPGIAASRYGYIVFASTVYGDAYCFDKNHLNVNREPRIVLISHEVVGEDATEAEVRRGAKPVAGSLLEFLELFSTGEVDEKCVY